MRRDNYFDSVAVIGFSSGQSPLEPVWPSTHRALLPVGNKALIVHAIEQLSAAGITRVRIAGDLQQFAVRKRLRNGEEWGVTIRYSDLHSFDLLVQTILEHGNCLYVLGDQMMDLTLDRPCFESSFRGERPLECVEKASYWKFENKCYKRAEITLNASKPDSTLLTAAGFHAANQRAISRSYAGITLPGMEINGGPIVDWQSSIDPRATVADTVIIGKHCYVGRGVVLERDCVVGNGAILSPNSHLSNVTVLPNSFIGPYVKLRDAVVTPSGIFDLKGNFWSVHDPAVLRRARKNEEEKTGLPSEKLSEIEQHDAADLPLSA